MMVELEFINNKKDNAMMDILNQTTKFTFDYDIKKIPQEHDLILWFTTGKKDSLNTDYSNFGNILLMEKQPEQYYVPSLLECSSNSTIKINNEDLLYFGKIDGRNCFCFKKQSFNVQDLESGSSLKPYLLKTSYKKLEISEFQAATLGHHLFHWLNTHRYCGVCAGSNTANTYEMALHCQNCGYRVYPTISPCVIAVIYKGDEILLAQAARTVTGAYGCISGYVSPGENLETALKREVMEEVGLKITNIQYITSQHWPFPNSILMGFTAEYLSGEIMVDKKEIADAKWFHRKDVDNLPVLPDPLSIARHLINLFIS